MPENIISCRPGSYGDFGLHAYEHLYEIGIRNLEISNPGATGVESTLDLLGDFHGMQVKSIQAIIPITEDDAGNLMREEVFEVAKALGATHIFVSLNPDKIKERDWVRRLRGVGDVALEFGLVIILETHPPLIKNGDVGRATMEKVNHPAIRINYDTANMFHYNEGIDGITELEKILPYVEGVHLKESNKKYQEWYFPGFGEGEGCVDFKGVVDFLNNRQDPGPFFGPFTMEIEGIKGEPKLTLEETKARVANSVEYLRSLGIFT